VWTEGVVACAKRGDLKRSSAQADDEGKVLASVQNDCSTRRPVSLCENGQMLALWKAQRWRGQAKGLVFVCLSNGCCGSGELGGTVVDVRGGNKDTAYLRSQIGMRRGIVAVGRRSLGL
jgi:hypothetical protein